LSLSSKPLCRPWLEYLANNNRTYLTEREHAVDENIRNIVFEMLINMEDVPESSDELEEFYVEPPQKKKHPLRSLSQHKKQAQEAWLALMHLGLSKEQRKKVLEVMATSIAPWFTQPELLMDFLTDCYNSGGPISLLALSGVFYLMQERNLDYPEFFTKLYSLLDADILHSKHRSRFIRLLDTFLGSSHLPAVLVASFIKRLARLAKRHRGDRAVVLQPVQEAPPYDLYDAPRAPDQGRKRAARERGHGRPVPARGEGSNGDARHRQLSVGDCAAAVSLPSQRRHHCQDHLGAVYQADIQLGGFLGSFIWQCKCSKSNTGR
jgi:hypothetical protein